ncbi:MAG: dTDP-4-dehydrorhamnose reductase, partial [Nitrospirae bacterium]
GKGDRIRPIPSSEFPTRAVRPAYSVLDTSFTEVVTGISLPDWRDSLSNFLRSLA